MVLTPFSAQKQPRIVIIGAGIVGCALADELTERGLTDVTLIERGPFYSTGGSTSHAPGLVFQTNASKTMTECAAYTVAKYRSLDAFDPVGGLELASTPERLHELERKQGWARSWGIPDTRLLTPDECVRLHPMLDSSKVYGGFHIPSDGLANAVKAAELQAERARERGAALHEYEAVRDIELSGNRVSAVLTDKDRYPADILVCCAGVWGPVIGKMVGVTVPLEPMAHQYAKSTEVPMLAELDEAKEASGASAAQSGERPILRHQDKDMYFREHGHRIGIGAYGHRPMPVRPDELTDNTVRPFTEEDFEPWWRESVTMLPGLADTKLETGFNGLFSFTPDGSPLLGESRSVQGFWLAEAIWITQSAGVARAVAEWIAYGQPSQDLHGTDANRFEDIAYSPAYITDRGCQAFNEVYDIVHPQQPKAEPRPLRVSPFYAREQELGAYFLEANGWERPHWYEANLRRLRSRDVPERGEWAGRYASPIGGAEALVTRERVAMYDMTSLQRMEVAGPGALAYLQRLTTNQLDKPPGRVTYTLMLNPDGGVRSDMTVARLDDERFQVAGNGRIDLTWMERHLPDDGSVWLRDITSGTCCIGVWGPLARELVQPLTETDFSHEAFRFFHVRHAYIENVPVIAMRVSYVGELGWELYTTAELGLRLWDTLWEAGQQFGVIAGGRCAFGSLRLEKGYRAWGTDMTTEHNPYEAGVGFAVRMKKGDFIGRDALEALGAPDVVPQRKLVALTSPDPLAVVMGGEPVYVVGSTRGDGSRPDGSSAGPVAPTAGPGSPGASPERDLADGYVTSADYGFTLARSIAYAWLPAEAATPGTEVEIGYFSERLPYVVTEEPLFDPEMTRLRS